MPTQPEKHCRAGQSKYIRLPWRMCSDWFVFEAAATERHMNTKVQADTEFAAMLAQLDHADLLDVATEIIARLEKHGIDPEWLECIRAKLDK